MTSMELSDENSVGIYIPKFVDLCKDEDLYYLGTNIPKTM